MTELPKFEAALLRRHDNPGPRYTSYPSALQFTPAFSVSQLIHYARRSNAPPVKRALSLYLHIPFCFSPCFYCGCNRIISRETTLGRAYTERLLRESARMASLFDSEREVVQLHLGGGTPN